MVSSERNDMGNRLPCELFDLVWACFEKILGDIVVSSSVVEIKELSVSIVSIQLDFIEQGCRIHVDRTQNIEVDGIACRCWFSFPLMQEVVI